MFSAHLVFLLRLALTSSDFRFYSYDWCAALGVHNNEVVLQGNRWTDNQHYICQHECE